MAVNPLSLGVIDAQWPGALLSMAPRLEALGYRRVWTTEHHSPHQSGNPQLLAAALGAATRAIRIGTAGAMLGLSSPRKLAEDFRLLELLFPSRVDVGLIGALPRGTTREQLLDGRMADEGDAFGERVRRFLEHLRDDPQVGPQVGRRPDGAFPAPAFLCGTSPRSARLASELGIGLAIQDLAPAGRAADGPAMLEEYRARFVAGPHDDRPRPILVAHGSCAPTLDEARSSWSPLFGLPPSFLGTPQQCRAQLEEIAERHGVDEVVVQLVAPRASQRMAGYEHLAAACALRGQLSVEEASA